MKSKPSIFLFPLLCLLLSCSQDNDSSQEETILIEDFLTSRAESFNAINSNLYYAIIDSGDMESPSFSSVVIIEYEIYNLQEDLLDASTEPLTINLDELINGISTSLTRIGRGGRMLVVMSSDQGNGEVGDDRIAPNTPLFVDVSLTEHYIDITDYHQRLLEAYLIDNGLPDSLIAGDSYYVIEDLGSLTPIVDTSTITMTYVGYYLDGTIFDQRYQSDPTTFALTDAIDGWQDILVNFNLNGAGTMLIPSEEAYGEEGTDLVLPDAPVLFDFNIEAIQ